LALFHLPQLLCVLSKAQQVLEHRLESFAEPFILLVFICIWKKNWLNFLLDEMEKFLKLLDKLGASQSVFLLHQDFLGVKSLHVNPTEGQLHRPDTEVALDIGVLGYAKSIQPTSSCLWMLLCNKLIVYVTCR